MTEATAVRVPMDVQYEGSWLSWVAAVTGCLRALGHEVDTADVAGMTGYAFVLNVHQELCPSGPTAFPRGLVEDGICRLGRTVLSFQSYVCHTRDHQDEHTRAACAEAAALARRELTAGRPVVIWGAYLPEYAIACGIDEQAYEVRSFRRFHGQPEEPVPFAGLEAPGGPCVLGFPTTVEVSQRAADRDAVRHAVSLLETPSWHPDYAFGSRGYDRWMEAVTAGHGGGFGMAYNAQCWADARHHAHEFLCRLAARNPDVPALQGAAELFAVVDAALRQVADDHPMPAGGESPKRPGMLGLVAKLGEAAATESMATELLREALAGWTA